MITASMLPALLGRPVAYQPVFTRLPGVSVQAAIFLSQALFLTNTPTAQRRAGWFYKDQTGPEDSWQAETGMTAKQQLNARKQLVGLGVLEEQRRGMPAKAWYRVNLEQLAVLLNEVLALENEENQAPAPAVDQIIPKGESRNAEAENQDCPDGSAQIPPNVDFFTETTTEITPSLSDAGESIFEQAARRDDQGETLPTTDRQFAMALDWKPEPQLFAMGCLRRGLPPETEYTASELLDFAEHFADQPKRFSTMGWVNRFARWVHENRQRLQAANANGDSRHAHRRDTDTSRHERDRIRQSLANPSDTSWADGWWPVDEEGSASGPDAGAGGSGFHSAGGAFPEDVQQRVSQCGPADAGPAGAGTGTGELGSVTHEAGGRAGNERDPEGGEYLAADDSGAGQIAFTDAGGFRSAGHG